MFMVYQIQYSINVLSKMLSKYFLISINKFHTYIKDIKEASITEKNIKQQLLFYNIVKNNWP